VNKSLRTISFLFLGLLVFSSERQTPSPNQTAKVGEEQKVKSNEKVINNPCIVSGKTCYPSEYIPPLTVYARNTKTNRTFSIKLKEDETYYRIEIPEEGEYIFFFWTHEKDSLGALYSKAVPCGLNINCTDHAPIIVSVKLGTKISDIDICDCYSPESVPQP
jgi:hypothetical protein